MNRKLKRGWFWSYIFLPMGIKKVWTACAVKPTGRYDRINHCPVFMEVFATGISEESAINKVKKLIKKEKWKIRVICNMEE